MRNKLHSQHFKVPYSVLSVRSSGETLFIALYGAAQDANVRLDKNSLRIESTYISMANQRSVVISNRSNVLAHFRWTQYATQEQEDQQKIM
jgi:hydrocephalus-inducing protein